MQVFCCTIFADMGINLIEGLLKVFRVHGK